jgi:hypothetical protein
MEELKPLNYQPADATRRNRNNRRAAMAVILTVVVASAVFWGPLALRWAEFLSWQRQCLNYSDSPDHVVCELVADTHGVRTASAQIPAYQNFRNFGTATAGWRGKTHPCLLLERQRPDGAKRLIAIDIYADGWPGPPTFSLDMWEPTWGMSPRLVHNTSMSGLLDFQRIVFPEQEHLRIFAAQPDPTDPTHFTFDYELNETHHAVDVWLSNADQLTLSERP